MKVILLAAGVGRRFGRRTRSLPKCLIPLNSRGQTLLSRYLDSFRKLKLKKIIIVVGHKKEKIISACRKYGTGLAIRSLFNKNFKEGSIVSLYSARGEMNEDCLIMDADIFFPTAALRRLLRSKHKTAFLIDTRSAPRGEEMMLWAKNGRPLAASKKKPRGLEALGECTGIFKVDKARAKLLSRLLKKFIASKKRNVEYEDSYAELLKGTRAGYEKIDGSYWTEMDFEEDLRKINKHG